MDLEVEEVEPVISNSKNGGADVVSTDEVDEVEQVFNESNPGGADGVSTDGGVNNPDSVLGESKDGEEDASVKFDASDISDSEVSEEGDAFMDDAESSDDAQIPEYRTPLSERPVSRKVSLLLQKAKLILYPSTRERVIQCIVDETISGQ